MTSYRYDEAKRAAVLNERGLDLAHACRAFGGFHLSRRDDRHSGVEERIVTVGMLYDGTVVIVVWTWRARTRRIVTMWKANERERQRYVEQRDRQRSGQTRTR